MRSHEGIPLDEFIARVARARPETLKASDFTSVYPKPWVLRAGSGKAARIRMQLGDLRYEREPGEAIWYLTDSSSDFDVEDAA